MEMTNGDLLDRYSILNLRCQHGNMEAFNECVPMGPEVCGLLERDGVRDAWLDLCDANRDIWQLESGIRKGQSVADGLGVTLPFDLGTEFGVKAMAAYALIGAQALEIRKINARRVAAKNKINAIFGDHNDVKIEHASEAKGPSLDALHAAAFPTPVETQEQRDATWQRLQAAAKANMVFHYDPTLGVS